MKPSGWFWVQVVNLGCMAAFLASSLWGVYMRPCPMGAGRAGSIAMLAFATAFAAFVMGTMVERELG